MYKDLGNLKNLSPSSESRFCLMEYFILSSHEITVHASTIQTFVRATLVMNGDFEFSRDSRDAMHHES